MRQLFARAWPPSVAAAQGSVEWLEVWIDHLGLDLHKVCPGLRARRVGWVAAAAFATSAVPNVVVCVGFSRSVWAKPKG